MLNIFTDVASRIGKSILVILVCLAFLALLIIGVGLWIEDYNTDNLALLSYFASFLLTLGIILYMGVSGCYDAIYGAMYRC